MAADRDQFLAELRAQFPDVVGQFRADEVGLLHCEMAAFRRATEAAMDRGAAWLAERHFRFLERMLGEAGPALSNAIEVSYLEDLALGDVTPERVQTVKERMPRPLRDLMARSSDRWR